MTEKLDRRKKYTRMVLKESLMKLLKEKPIAAITVKEICKLADINRSTFYSHYSDHYDLLYKIEEEIFEDLSKTLASYNYNKEEETLQMIEKLFEYVVANKDICEILFSDHGDASFQKKIMIIARESAVKTLIASGKIDSEVSDYVSLFAVSGSISVIKSWLETGMERSPKEMAEIIARLTKKGISSFS